MNTNTRSIPAHPRKGIGPDRKSVEDEIERLVGILDRLDGDPDLEDNADGGRTIVLTWPVVRTD